MTNIEIENDKNRGRLLDNEHWSDVLVQAMPYFKQWCGKVVVVKYGGNAMLNDELKLAVMKDLVLLHTIGVHVVLVHGGGPEINKMLDRVGKESKFVNGDIENSGEEILTNARQYSAVCDCLASVISAKYALSSFGDDIAGTELELAASAISELDGREVSVDVVDHIFHKFCVGK